MREWLSSAEREIVNLFWKRCGEIEPFPRALERSVALALPLALIKLPRLQLSRIEGWLQQRGITYQFNCHTRAVRGCLIAFGGAGTLFVDGSDPDDEVAETEARTQAAVALLVTGSAISLRPTKVRVCIET